MSEAYDIELGPDVDYRPSGKLDLDTRPLKPGELRRYRNGLRWVMDEAPTPADCAERFDVVRHTWNHWEREGVDRSYRAAMLREWLLDPAIDLKHDNVTPGYLRAFAHLCGSWGDFSEALDLRPKITEGWTRRGTPRGACALLWWLIGELGLEPRDNVLGGPDPRLTVAQVREIRRRYEDSEAGYRTIAKDFPVTWMMIKHVVNGACYRWVDGGAA